MPELPEVEVVRRGLERWVERPYDRRRRGAAPACRPPASRGRRRTSPAGCGATASVRPGGAASISGSRSTPGICVLGHLGHERSAARPAHGHARREASAYPDPLRRRSVGDRTALRRPAHLRRPLAARRDPGRLPDVIAHIARDPLDPAFDDDAFHSALRRRRTTIKRALLDQSLISGVGNIYADEALWRARLHYDRPTATFTRPRTAELLGHVRDVMNEALAVGGTSFDSLYVNVNGESGYFERSLDAYGREDEPCRRCGTPIRRRPWMNRSSYFCPKCQPPPRARRSGPMAPKRAVARRGQSRTKENPGTTQGPYRGSDLREPQ